ncbi:LysR family transcriptional regulator [Ectothiorhodospiraceae bacterium WFHF3C12]|nr:LysR family transcriptional regulator [Ectothiorhodospiraceae bacterium WFHF3C12]
MARIRADWLDTFIAAVDTGSFTAAAQRVHRSQSAVSLQIGQLEQVLGRRLLDRGPGRLRPTVDGERLLPHVRRASEAIETVSNVFSAPRPGPVRVGMPEEYADGILPELLARFGRTHPNALLEVDCAPSSSLEARVKDGSLDLAVALDEEIAGTGQLLAEDPTCWVASVNLHHHDRHEPLPVAVFDSECSWRRWALDALDDARIPYRIAYTSGNVSALRAAIRAGMAIGLLGASTLTDDLQPYRLNGRVWSMPASRLVLLESSGADQAVVSTLTALLREGLTHRRPQGA